MRESKPLRILHLIKSLGRGGAEVLLAEGLAAADRDAFRFEYAYFLPWKDALVPMLESQGAQVTCFAAKSSLAVLRSSRRVARYLREAKIDLVHAHLPLAGVVARQAGKMAGVPVVYTEHNLQERYHRLTRWLNLRTWHNQATAIAVSDDVADSIRRHAGDSVPIATVQNGVNVHTFDPATHDGREVRSQLGIPFDAPVVGTVAVFREQKRLDIWVQVAKRVTEKVPEVHFILVGDGAERSHLESWIAAAGLQANMHLVGLQEETRPYFAAMDAYLMTSDFEGQPIALLEAMSMSLPPVVTAVGGIPEVVESGENGFLAGAADKDSLANGVIRLLQDGELRKQLGTSARETIVRGFSIERMQRELEAIYSRILLGPRANETAVAKENSSALST